jgi:hypothetical protein
MRRIRRRGLRARVDLGAANLAEIAADRLRNPSREETPVIQRLGDGDGHGEHRRRGFQGVPVVPDAGPRDLGKACTCGHGKKAHEHYRRGTDCALCSCARFHRRLLDRLRFRRR